METPILAARMLARAATSRLRPRTAGYVMRRVSTRDDWAAVRSLRAAALESLGDIPAGSPSPTGDGHDTQPGTTTFLLARDGRSVATTRISVAVEGASATLPAARSFGGDLARVVRGTVVEASCILVDPAEEDRRNTLLRLFKSHLLACVACNADWLVTAAREAQMGFYRRTFGMEILGGAECLEGLALPRVLMGLRWRRSAAELARRIPLVAWTSLDERRFAMRGEVTFAERDAARDPHRCA